jgi:hypothetical protein
VVVGDFDVEQPKPMFVVGVHAAAFLRSGTAAADRQVADRDHVLEPLGFQDVVVRRPLDDGQPGAGPVQVQVIEDDAALIRPRGEVDRVARTGGIDGLCEASARRHRDQSRAAHHDHRHCLGIRLEGVVVDRQ